MSGTQTQFDVAIVGGGLVGMGLACALDQAVDRGRARSHALIEARRVSEGDFSDGLTLSLSVSSQRILQGLGVWERVRSASNSITRIHISSQGQFGALRLSAEELDLPTLAYLVDAKALNKALRTQLQAGDTVCISPARCVETRLEGQRRILELDDASDARAVACSLLVAADGSHSTLRRQLGIDEDCIDHGQSLIICPVATQGHDPRQARERFTEHGPIAFLPHNETDATLIYTVEARHGEACLGMQKKDFLARVEAELGGYLGRLRCIGDLRMRPALKSICATKQIAERGLLLGNAAFSLHPHAAQGMNLCLRDVAALAEALHAAADRDMGGADLLQEWQRARTADQQRILWFNRQLCRSFYSRSWTQRALRRKIIAMLAHCAPLRQSFALALSGLYGRQAHWVRCP